MENLIRQPTKTAHRVYGRSPQQPHTYGTDFISILFADSPIDQYLLTAWTSLEAAQFLEYSAFTPLAHNSDNTVTELRSDVLYPSDEVLGVRSL